MTALSALAAHLGLASLHVKHDDRTHPELGGNKLRKLEYLLADALDRGSRALVTFGGIGSNHALATAFYGRTLGLDTVAVLAPQPWNPSIDAYLRAHRQLGTWVVGARSTAPTMDALRRLLPRPYIVAAGGSSPLGTLGYVGAGLELAAQVEAAALPPPDHIIVPAGSLGTAVGLAFGVALGGLDTTIEAISTVPWPLQSRRRLNRALADQRRFMKRRLGLSVTPAPVQFANGFVGAGYGHRTSAGDAATALFEHHGGPTLDSVYTAKAGAGLLGLARTRLAGRRVLFWHTKGWWPDIEAQAAALTA